MACYVSASLESLWLAPPKQSHSKKKDAERRAEYKKTKKMTPAEREAYSKNKLKITRAHNTVSDLITGAGLSEAQAKIVAKELYPQHRSAVTTDAKKTSQ